VARTSQPNDRLYRLFVRTGLFLRWLFRIRVIVTGIENLPAPGPRLGGSRQVRPGFGAVLAVTHFGYLDFAIAELVVWKHARAQLRFLIHQGADAEDLARGRRRGPDLSGPR
jgi:1-acyl-sn-glycerol-3-phosphate acyltransferase